MQQIDAKRIDGMSGYRGHGDEAGGWLARNRKQQQPDKQEHQSGFDHNLNLSVQGFPIFWQMAKCFVIKCKEPGLPYVLKCSRFSYCVLREQLLKRCDAFTPRAHLSFFDLSKTKNACFTKNSTRPFRLASPSGIDD
jgi:hypothetical protein